MVVAAAGCVATDGAVGDFHCSASGNAAAPEGEVASDCAASNREYSLIARNAAAPRGRVIVHSAVGDRQRSVYVINTAARA